MDQLLIQSFSDELVKIGETKRERRLFQLLRRHSPVEVKKTEDAKQWGGGYFHPGKSEIGISDERFDTLAHEVGHAKNHEKLWGKLIQNVPTNLAYLLAPVAGAFAGHALQRGKKWPLIIPAAAVTPVLLAEALATQTGKKTLEDLGAKNEEVEKYKRNLRSSFSTYLANAAIPTAAFGTLGYMVARAARPA